MIDRRIATLISIDLEILKTEIKRVVAVGRRRPFRPRGLSAARFRAEPRPDEVGVPRIRNGTEPECSKTIGARVSRFRTPARSPSSPNGGRPGSNQRGLRRSLDREERRESVPAVEVPKRRPTQTTHSFIRTWHRAKSFQARDEAMSRKPPIEVNPAYSP